ncbi:uncharacterized protein LOC134224360 [Armigeres subalbatus]|uniref:uncharacterized protein LOC134214785 n=1 Tax=Armigeres subalbatus TaxID=124917 RepID=UPI002ED1836E
MDDFIDYDIELLESEELVDLTQSCPSQNQPPKPASKKKRRMEFFSNDEKKLLISKVKSHPAIWSLQDPDHHNNGAIRMAWKQIAGELCRTPDQCKTAWIAIRESHRYRKRMMLKRSGSDGGEPLPGPSTEDLDWEFAEDLAFLPDISRKRKTFTTAQNGSSQIALERITGDANGNSQSNYFYQTHPSQRKPREDETVSILADNIAELIQHQKSTPQTDREEHPIVHKTALANIDRMLQQLPPHVIEDSLFEITTLLYNKIRLYRSE